MQIDWITVTAQIVNFLVLVWLLHRFLYGPIIGAMERREHRIAQRMRLADEARAQAEIEAESFRAQTDSLAQKREQLLREAQDSAEMERKQLQQAARDEVEQQRRGWMQDVDAQRSQFLRGVRSRATEHFYAMARRALGDLADVDLERQLSAVFVRELDALDVGARKKLLAQCDSADGAVAVRSRFEMPASEKRYITTAIHERIRDDLHVTYAQDENLTCGIELSAGSQTVSWGIDGYLDALEDAVDDELRGLTSAS